MKNYRVQFYDYTAEFQNAVFNGDIPQAESWTDVETLEEARALAAKEYAAISLISRDHEDEIDGLEWVENSTEYDALPVLD